MSTFCKAIFLVSLLSTLPVTTAIAATNSVADDLPLEVRIDLLREQLASHLKNDNNQGIVDLIPQFRALDLAIPDNLYFLEGRALYRLGRALEARDRLVLYLRNTGREGTYYQEATELLLAVREQAQIQEQQRQEEERKRREELARRAEKARMLRIREAQRYLYDVGFPNAEETGVLTKPTREAIAVYQIRRDLEVNGDVTDQTIDSLKAEVPDEHTCDTLTRYARKPTEVSLPISQIAPQIAINTCNEALRNHPDVVRFQVQYARALIAGNRATDARNAVQAAVEKGYPEAEVLMGMMHERGALDERGRPDYESATPWYQKAAGKEYPPAVTAIARYYLDGLGNLTRDYNAAAEWFSRAANRGYPPAQVALARLYVDGRGPSRDYGTALAWLQQAVELNYADAQFMMGEMYERGRGVERDRRQAVDWYRRAANQGHPDAAAKVARLGG